MENQCTDTANTPADSLVVVSFYNARPADHLVSLLDQLASIPAGQVFDLIVVVNKGVDVPLSLPERHRDTRILYRENFGFNIGAWDYGWRSNRNYRYYLFLQDECVVARDNWLKGFIDRMGDRPALLGECMVYDLPACVSGNQEFIDYVKQIDAVHEVPENMANAHLQTLVIFSANEVLARINGFPVSKDDKAQAVATEVSLSRVVSAAGYPVRQVGFYPFKYVMHPQWEDVRRKVRSLPGTLKRLYRTLAS